MPPLKNPWPAETPLSLATGFPAGPFGHRGASRLHQSTIMSMPFCNVAPSIAPTACANHMALRIDEKGGGQRVCAIRQGCFSLGIKQHREFISMPVDECRGRLDGFPSTIGHVDHNKMDVITERAVLLVKIRHLALTRATPACPEIQYNGFPEILAEAHFVAGLVIHRKIGRGNDLGLLL